MLLLLAWREFVQPHFEHFIKTDGPGISGSILTLMKETIRKNKWLQVSEYRRTEDAVHFDLPNCQGNTPDSTEPYPKICS